MTDNVKGFPRRGTNEKLPHGGTNEKLSQKGTSEKFWQRFQSGIDVAVGGDLPDKLLGVREGFVRYFHHGLERSVPVSVKPQPLDEARTPCRYPTKISSLSPDNEHSSSSASTATPSHSMSVQRRAFYCLKLAGRHVTSFAVGPSY